VHRSILTALLVGAAWALSGCPSVEEVQEPLPPPPVKEEPARVEFESTTDTVAVTNAGRADSANVPGREQEIRFMVQIGAFKDPRLAAAVQARARERYRMPVLNDFSLTVGLYQIRIGFFETRGAAFEFRARMQKEYQEEYRDAWVVQLRR
jgi:cell division septation protein DedD